MTPIPNHPRLSLQEIWQKGCRKEELHPADQEHFVKMARSRFHTFLLGMQHAEGINRRTGTSSTQSALLVRGMLRELNDYPGLETEWHRYHFADSTFGQLVSDQLRPKQNWLTRTLSRLSGAKSNH